MNDSVLRICWERIKRDDLNAFHDVLLEINNREYSHEEMITILKFTPRYLVIEAILYDFDTPTREAIYQLLTGPAYSGLLERPSDFEQQ